MKCLKTRHPVLTYSLFAFFASALFCVFGLSQKSYATELCSYTFTSNISTNTNICDNHLSEIKYISFDYGHDNSNGQSTIRITFNTNGYANTVNRSYELLGFGSTLSYSILQTVTGMSSGDTLVVKAYDDFPSGDCPVCEVCQECPVIPDNPYDQKLDNITKAIYVCGAILIMLYFFFCIYKIIVKDGGSR